MALIPGGARRTEDMQGGIAPMPEATYALRADKVEIKMKKNAGPDDAPYINIMWTVTAEGEYLGRKIFDILTLKKGADFKLKGLLEILGIDEFEDTDQLDKAEVTAAVTIEKGQQGYDDRNKVMKYLSAN